MSENIGQKRRLNFFSGIFRYYHQIENDDKIKHRNISEKKFSLLCPIFSDMRMFLFGLTFVLCVLRLSGSNGFLLQQ